jgi:hypothetical protein
VKFARAVITAEYGRPGVPDGSWGGKGQAAATVNSLPLSALLVFFTSLLHITRNISSLYFGIYGMVFLIFIISTLKSPSKYGRFGPILFFISIAFCYCAVISYYHSANFGDPIIGIARLSFIIPCIFAIAYGANRDSFSVFCRVWLIFVLLSALSLLLQFVIGPISWFAESFERAGTARYGSLAGSLTTFGNVVGAGLFTALMITRRWHYAAMAVGILALGGLASLQKAAFASIGIAIFTLVLARQVKFSTVAGMAFGLGSIAALGFYFSDYQTKGILINLFETFIGTVDARQASDVSIFQSISDRIFDLPLVAFDYYGADRVWTGIGVFGGSGGLGYPELPHTHNLVGETILMFGLVPGVTILLYLFYMFLKSFAVLINFDNRYDIDATLAAGIFFNIVAATTLSGALFYHPASGSVFWLSLIYLQVFVKKRSKPIDCN